MKHSPLALVAALAVFPASVAFGQQMLGPQPSETPIPTGRPEAAATAQTSGFPIGDKSRIHTTLDLGAGYDTNPYRNPPGQEVGDARAEIYPGLDINVPGHAIHFDLGSKLTIDRYFGVNGAVAQTIFGGNINVAFGAGGNDSPVSFELFNTVTRTPTFFNEVGTAGSQELKFREWANRGLAMLVFRPGGGALEIRGGYSNNLSFYDNLPQAQQHGMLVEAKLRFLPKTAAIFGGDLSFFSTTNDPSMSTHKSAPYDVYIGLQGQILTRLAANLRVGFQDALTFTDGFFSGVTTADQRTVVGTAQLAYSFYDRGTVTVGYRRRIFSVIILDSYVGDAAQARLTFGIGPRLNLDVFGEFENRNFAGQGMGDSHSAQIVTGDVRMEYFFFDWLSGLLGYQLLHQDSNETTGSLPASAIFLEKYTRHLVFLSANFRY
jgi:hypothetical protein